ncbi:hypothetical protein ACRE1U_03285 [Helicobacter himalayensis]|uniref:hypothetical protein n=1 Tax=Helicobacter himalayensis TaxID=1591088 RepID=UPI003D6DCF74
MIFNALKENLNERTILPRRYGILPGRTFLFGAPKSGKTSLALQFALSYKKPMYLDLDDVRLDSAQLQTYLLKIFLEKKLDILVLDNFKPTLTLPNLQNIILLGARELAPSDFTPKCIMPLCFEEFVSFSAKNFSLKNLFAFFLKDGNMPEMLETPHYKKEQRRREVLKLYFGADLEIFLFLLHFQAQAVSIHRIYTALKKQTKISKDRIYTLLKRWEENGVLFFVPHSLERTNEPMQKLAKKLYFADFSLSWIVKFENNILAQFENMLFLELVKMRELSGGTISYEEGMLVYKDCAYLPIPFATRELCEKRLQKCTQNTAYIITLSFEDSGEFQCNIRGKKERRESAHKDSHQISKDIQSARTDSQKIFWRALNFIDFALGELAF